MNAEKPEVTVGTDWTRLLADPELAQNVGKLLQAYREAPPESRDEALLDAMREIKQKTKTKAATPNAVALQYPETRPRPASSTPPFEPDIFSANWNQDRRQHPRIRCFVAVELHVDGSEAPIWGNLADTSVGGCHVETAKHVRSGAKVEIGLWVASGKIWVKGFALDGVVTRSAPAAGVRVRFAAMNSAEKESLRQFLKYVQETTKSWKSENGYLQLMKK